MYYFHHTCSNEDILVVRRNFRPAYVKPLNVTYYLLAIFMLALLNDFLLFHYDLPFPFENVKLK